jgi:hypothetical protein
MAALTPEQAIMACAREAVERGFVPDNPQMAARMKAIREGKKINEAEIVAAGGCDHPDPTLWSADPSCLKTLRSRNVVTSK